VHVQVERAVFERDPDDVDVPLVEHDLFGGAGRRRPGEDQRHHRRKQQNPD
jgi:hypothetical protein